MLIFWEMNFLATRMSSKVKYPLCLENVFQPSSLLLLAATLNIQYQKSICFLVDPLNHQILVTCHISSYFE